MGPDPWGEKVEHHWVTLLKVTILSLQSSQLRIFQSMATLLTLFRGGTNVEIILPFKPIPPLSYWTATYCTTDLWLWYTTDCQPTRPLMSPQIQPYLSKALGDAMCGWSVCWAPQGTEAWQVKSCAAIWNPCTISVLTKAPKRSVHWISSHYLN